MSRQHLKTSLFQKVTKFSCLDEDLGGTDILPWAFHQSKLCYYCRTPPRSWGYHQYCIILHFLSEPPNQGRSVTNPNSYSVKEKEKNQTYVCVCVALFPSKWSQFCGFWHSIAQNNAEKEGVHCSLGLFHIKKKAPKLFLKSPSFTVISTFIEH